MENRGELLFGVILLIGGISLLTTKRAAAKGERILRDWAPNTDRKILVIGLRFRWVFTVLCLLVGAGFTAFGLVTMMGPAGP
jgi:hypothetical protein